MFKGMPGGMPGGMANLLKQANQMQSKVKKLQDEFATRTFEATSGGGAVRVTVLGDKTIQAVVIQPDVMATGDVEMLQDMIISATNEALKTARATLGQEMDKITGGMGLPGIF
jgi:DNA-binding YbaB/EbfC family protein